MGREGPETKFVHLVRRSLSIQYGKKVCVWKFHATEYDPPGVPDLIGHIEGLFVGLEIKANGGYPTHPQVEWVIENGQSGAFTGFLFEYRDEAYFCHWTILLSWQELKKLRSPKFSYEPGFLSLCAKLPYRRTPTNESYVHLKTSFTQYGLTAQGEQS